MLYQIQLNLLLMWYSLLIKKKDEAIHHSYYSFWIIGMMYKIFENGDEVNRMSLNAREITMNLHNSYYLVCNQ